MLRDTGDAFAIDCGIWLPVEELSTQALPLLPNFLTLGSCVRGCAWLLGFSVVPCSAAAMTIDYMECHEALC